MKKLLKTPPKTWRSKAAQSKLSPKKILVLAALNFLFPFWRAAAVGVALLLGGYFIVTHQTIHHTLAGFALWAVAVYLSLDWFPRVPGAGIFPMTRAPEAKGSPEWSWWKTALVGAGALVALGLSNYFLGKAWAVCLLFSLLALGWCLTLLEDRLPRALGGKVLEPAPSHGIGFPWAALVILLFGSFFLFFGRDRFILGYDADSYKSFELTDSCVTGNAAPYVDGWIPGDPLFPFFVIGMFCRVVGCTFQKADFFMALVNLAGYLFFYGFVRFYLPKAPALAAALLLCTSHWVIYPARQISGVWGMLIPLECATLYFFARALEKGQARDYALFGTLLTFTVLSNILGWEFLFFFILVLSAFWVWQRPALQNQKKSWALALLVGFLWYLPMMIYYYKIGNPYCFPIYWFKKDVYLQGASFFIPWDNFRSALQMFNIGFRVDWLMEYLPLLSPWEGLFLLAGLGWCLRRFLKPFAPFIIVGLLGGVSAVCLKNEKHVLGSLPAAPFVFLLVGIGLDRLMMALTAPLGRQGKTLRLLLGGAALALAVGWQYDVYFDHLPRYSYSYWNPSGRAYLFGTITGNHLEGWDTYVDSFDGAHQYPENDYFYSKSDMDKGKRMIFHPDLSFLPLKSIPSKGALVLLPDQMGKTFEEWIAYYYPDSKEQLILNPFGDVEFRLWEITPDQIQKALASPRGTPPGEMVLSGFDAQNHPLGQWTIPTLSADVLNREWFPDGPDRPRAPIDKAAYFTLRGTLENPAGKVLAVGANGGVEGFIDGRKILLDGRDPSKRLQIPLPSGKPDSFKIRYVLPKGGGFFFNLLEKTPLGWDVIPSSELKP